MDDGEGVGGAATTLIGRATPVTVVGDSTTVIFDGLTFRHASRPSQTFVFRAAYLAESSLLDLVDEKGPSALFLSALQHARVVEPVETTRALARKNFEGSVDALPDGMILGEDVPLLVTSGYRDFFRPVRRFGPLADFELPHVRHGSRATEVVGTTYPVPTALVEETLVSSLAALERALAPLVDGGLRAIYVLGLRPPSLDDGEVEHRWNLCSRQHLRYKISLLFNERTREVCERIGVRFLDPWPLMTVDGVFDERLELDHMHFNREAACRVAIAMLDDFLARADASGERDAAPGGSLEEGTIV